jgi:hypothetical protein
LFSAPVPKPVLVVPLQVTTLPDCTQAAAAGADGNISANAGRIGRAARAKGRRDQPARRYLCAVTIPIRSALVFDFIFDSRLLQAEAAIAGKMMRTLKSVVV